MKKIAFTTFLIPIFVFSQTCFDFKNYSVYPNPELTPIKTIRISFHVTYKSDGSGSYIATDDQVINYFNEIIKLTNYRLSHNELPNPNVSSPLVEDVRLSFLLYKVYFYRDDSTYKVLEDNTNDRDNGVWFYNHRILNNKEYSDIEKYNALHIILEPKYDGHLPKSHNEGGQANGIFDKSWIVFRSFDYNYNNPISGDFVNSIAQCTGHLLHEAGHSLGLFHSFKSQCDDDCLDNGCPPDKTSNNYMDYTPWLNTRSFSECQISRIHFGLMGLSGNISDIMVDDYCNNLVGPIIRIKDTISIGGKRYMNQNIVIRYGLLNITCEVSMTAKSKIVIDKMGILNLENGVLHNKCNLSWKGVIVKKEGSMVLNSSNIAGYTIQVKAGGTLIVRNEVVLRDAKIVLERGAYLCMGKKGKIATIGNKNGFIQKNGVIKGVNPNILIEGFCDITPTEIKPN